MGNFPTVPFGAVTRYGFSRRSEPTSRLVARSRRPIWFGTFRLRTRDFGKNERSAETGRDSSGSEVRSGAARNVVYLRFISVYNNHIAMLVRSCARSAAARSAYFQCRRMQGRPTRLPSLAAPECTQTRPGICTTQRARPLCRSISPHTYAGIWLKSHMSRLRPRRRAEI